MFYGFDISVQFFAVQIIRSVDILNKSNRNQFTFWSTEQPSKNNKNTCSPHVQILFSYS